MAINPWVISLNIISIVATIISTGYEDPQATKILWKESNNTLLALAHVHSDIYMVAIPHLYRSIGWTIRPLQYMYVRLLGYMLLTSYLHSGYPRETLDPNQSSTCGMHYDKVMSTKVWTPRFPCITPCQNSS